MPEDPGKKDSIEQQYKRLKVAHTRAIAMLLDTSNGMIFYKDKEVASKVEAMKNTNGFLVSVVSPSKTSQMNRTQEVMNKTRPESKKSTLKSEFYDPLDESFEDVKRRLKAYA